MARPVTRATASMRGCFVPNSLNSDGGVSATSSTMSRESVLPASRSAYETAWLASARDATRPSPATSSAAGRSSRSAASSSSAWRAVAAALRSCRPTRAVDWLPKVPMSHGTRSVSDSTTVTASSGSRSSSATSIARPVRMPWPYSTLPAYATAVPSGRTTSHRAGCRLRGGVAVRGARVARRRGRTAGPRRAHDAEALVDGGRAHRAASAVDCDARSTARRMRWYVPQRHMFCERASRTCASPGCGSRRSSATVVMMKPGMQ